MTVNDWLSLIGSVGLIGAGSLIGSLITVVVTHFLEKGKLKTERQSNLQKEIYFKLQEQSGKLFKELNFMNRQVEEMGFWLQRKVYTEITKISVVETISEMSIIQAHFSKDILDKYNKVATTFKSIVMIYCDAGKTLGLPKENTDKWNNDLMPSFHSQMNDCVSAVLLELDNNKKMIL